MQRASAFVIDPVKTFLTSSSIIMQNLVVVSRTVRPRAKGSKNSGDAGARPARLECSSARSDFFLLTDYRYWVLDGPFGSNWFINRDGNITELKPNETLHLYRIRREPDPSLISLQSAQHQHDNVRAASHTTRSVHCQDASYSCRGVYGSLVELRTALL